MRKTIFLLMVSFFILGMTGCNPAKKGHEASETKMETPEASTETSPSTDMMIHATMDIGKFYNSVESLSQEASIVIQGVVQNREFFQSERVPYTKSIVKVTKVISGKVVVGDLVIFVERGGIRTKGEIAKNKPGKIHIKSGEENDQVPVVFNGIENMKTEDEVLLFGRLNDRNVLSLPQDFYTCVGGFQGKFQVKGNKAKRLTDYLDAVDKTTFPTLEMELTKLEAKVRSVKK